jgi:hypothetical protein
MAFALFISRNDIIKNTPLGGAIDADKLIPFLRTAQEKYILNLLGTILYDALQTKITAGSVTGDYQTLLEDYVKPTLIWYACTEYIPFSSIDFKAGGAVKHLSEQSTAPTKNELDYLLNKALNNADYYATRMQDWLISTSNAGGIPEYLQVTGDQTEVYPDKSSQYYGGIHF